MPANVLNRSESGIPQVTAYMVAKFAGALPAAAVERVVLTARQDLGREVPPEAMDEFLHRLAWQRLVDLHAGAHGDDWNCAIYQQKGSDERPSD